MNRKYCDDFGVEPLTSLFDKYNVLYDHILKISFLAIHRKNKE